MTNSHNIGLAFNIQPPGYQPHASQGHFFKANAPGAMARPQTNFGDATGYGKIGAEYFTMDARTDIAPLLQRLEKDLCQAPHWGYIIKGDLTVTFTNGETEDAHSGDLFYWPPGHSVKVNQDAEFVLFSPQHEHSEMRPISYHPIVR